MRKKFYITTPIYYVNAAPHIGHSYTTIAADTLARYMRAKLGDENVWLLTGTDEHGQKIQRVALEKKLTPKEYVDGVSVQFKDLWKKLNISYNDFIRTTESRHTQTVQKILAMLYEKGDIYQATYEGWYCTPCETFWTQTQVPDRVCPDCKRPVEKIVEQNYFYKLRQHQGWLIDHIQSHPDFIRPENRRNEVLSFLKMNELSDLCISRPKERLSWGIPLPFSPEHVTYVWFDALVNYISAVGSFDGQGHFSSSWWNDDCTLVHLIGKDILRQHAVYWPIMLHGMGIPLPEGMTIFAHGWWMMGDSKMSKSVGNVVDPLAMVDKYGLDVYRYFLLRDVPFGGDGNFSEASLVKRLNGDLANDLGNLVYRTLTMIEKIYQGAIPQVDVYVKIFDDQGQRIKECLRDKGAPLQQMDTFMCAAQDFNFSEALARIWELINLANKYVEETKPWNLIKENKREEHAYFIRLLVEVIRKAAALISPYMPQTAASILAQMGGDTVHKTGPLFPRIENKPA